MRYGIEIKPLCKKSIKKLCKKNPVLEKAMKNKIEEILLIHLGFKSTSL